MRHSRMMSAPPKRKKGRFANLVLIAVILGIAAYLIGAGAAGSWLADNVINPVFNGGNANAAASFTESARTVTPGETPSASPSAAPPSGRTEERITVNEISVYALQMGAFSDKANAETAAAAVKAKGGAGYIVYDGSLYKVLVAGYTDRNDADQVMASLKTQGMETTLYELKSGTLTFKIGAERAQIDAVKACFDAAPDTVAALEQIIFDADKGKNVDGDISALKDRISGVADDFSAAVSSGETSMKDVADYFGRFRDTVAGIPVSSSVSAAGFSSALKYALIQVAADYSSFLNKLSA